MGRPNQARGLGSLPRRGQTDRARLPRITSQDRRGRPNQAGAWDHFLIVGRPTGLVAQDHFPRPARQTKPGQGAWDHFLGAGRPTGLGCPGSLPEIDEADQTRLGAWDHFLIVGRPTGLRGPGSLPQGAGEVSRILFPGKGAASKQAWPRYATRQAVCDRTPEHGCSPRRADPGT